MKINHRSTTNFKDYLWPDYDTTQWPAFFIAVTKGSPHVDRRIDDRHRKSEIFSYFDDAVLRVMRVE